MATGSEKNARRVADSVGLQGLSSRVDGRASQSKPEQARAGSTDDDSDHLDYSVRRGLQVICRTRKGGCTQNTT
mgnify:CR=1 FL=1